MNPKSLMVAGAAALLIISGAVTARADESASSASAQVKCLGANSCKGQGACATANNGCRGQNACKGQGFVMASSAQDCTSKGGKVMTGSGEKAK